MLKPYLGAGSSSVPLEEIPEVGNFFSNVSSPLARVPGPASRSLANTAAFSVAGVSVSVSDPSSLISVVLEDEDFDTKKEALWLLSKCFKDKENRAKVLDPDKFEDPIKTVRSTLLIKLLTFVRSESREL